MRYGDLKTNIHSRKGITLVELVVAMALTSIFAVLCVMLINPIERTYRGTLKLARAQLLADTILDSIRKECDDVRHDEKADVWITNLSGNDDADLFSGAPAEEKDSGNTLVFRKNNNYSEAIYSCVPISRNNYEKVHANPVKYTNVDDPDTQIIDNSIDTLVIGTDPDNIPAVISKKGIVHFGYYQSKEDEKGILPFRAYDYSDPVLTKTYGDFTVDLEFSELTRKEGKYPAYVMCKISIKEKDTVVYSRSAVLCFSANGSGNGSGGSHNVDPKLRDIEVTVVWEDGSNTANRPAAGLGFVLKNTDGATLGTHNISDVKTSNKQVFVFKNIDTKNGFNLSISPEHLDGYNRSVKKSSNGYLVTYTLEENELVLIPGPDFNNKLRINNRHRAITSFIFAPSDDSHLALVQNTKLIWDVAQDTRTNKITDDYKLYLVQNGSANTYTAYVLSKTGSFNGNEIMGCMFEGCESATQFTGLELILTSKTKDMHRMFKNCKKLTTIGASNSIYIDWDTSSVETYDSMFYNVACNASLTDNITINVSNFKFDKCHRFKEGDHGDADQINGINKMFYADKEQVSRVGTIIFPSGHKDMHNLNHLIGVFGGCDNLTTLVNFSDWDCSGVEKFENVFTYCDSLRNITITDWNLSGLKNLNGFFNTVNANAPVLANLETINLSGLNVSSATNLNNLFKDKSSLTTVNLSGCTTNQNDSWTMESMFYNCTSLSTLDMSNFVNSKCSTLSKVFYNCSSLNNVDLSTWDCSGVQNMSYIFYGCSNLAGSLTDNMFEISSMDMSSCTTMQSAFQGCTSIKKLKFNKVNLSSCKTYTDFITNCSALTNVEISESDMSGATGLRFLNCVKFLDFHGTIFGMPKLEQTFSKENGSIVETIDFTGATFKNCTSFKQMFSGSDTLTSATFTGISAPKLTNCSYMFENCTGLTTYSFIDVSLDACTTISYMFTGCTNLTEVYLNGLTTPSLTNCSYMFSGCTNLTEVFLTGLKTPSLTDCSYMFQNCSNLDIGAGHFAGWDTSSVKNMSCIFRNCIKMGYKSNGVVRLADMDLSSCTTMYRAFEGCISMTTLKLDYIDFKICSNFTELYFGCPDFTNIEMTNSNLIGIKNLAFLFDVKNIDLSGSTLSFGKLESTFVNKDIESFILNGTHFPNCTSFNQLFSGCKKLKKVEMVGLDTPKLTNCYGMFQYCYSLSIAEGKTSGWNSASVTNVSNMFYNACYRGDDNFAGSSDAILDISGLKFTNISNFNQMFYYEKKIGDVLYDPAKDVLKTIILPSGTDAVTNAASVTTYRMFNCREHLTEIRNLKYFGLGPNTVVTNANSTFARTGLTIMDISGFDLNKITGTADYLFNQSYKLTTIYVHPRLAEDNKFAAKTLTNLIFEDCTTNLVGQNNTRWENTTEKMGYSYGKVDKDGSPGYFSIKSNT